MKKDGITGKGYGYSMDIEIMSKQDTYMKSLDITKAILMIFVVLGHSIAMVNEDYFHLGIQKSEFLSLISIWIGSIHVYAFTFVSGFLYSYLRAGGVLR